MLCDAVFCLVNHAVYESRPAPLKDMTLKQWQGTFEANLTSSFLIIRAFLRQVEKLSDAQKDKVAVVLIGSTAGKYGEAGKCDPSCIPATYERNSH